ncbi:MAG: hypothetical protein H0W06_04165 [Chloroflexia bacterium]|nr:hypothetical protein [Chloroflexia bacterium]
MARRAARSHPRLPLSVLVLALLIAGCGPIGRDEAPERVAACLAGLPAPVSETRGLFVEPDDGRAPILEELAAARCTIDLTIYLISDDATIDALEAAVARGVQVRVILEEHPFGGGGDQPGSAAELRAAGISVRWGQDRFRFTHAKYAVIDARTSLILNQNLTRSSFERNREFGVISTVAADVREARTIFDADWEGRPPSGPFALIVSPDNSRVRLGELINGAQRSLDLYAEVVRDPAMLAELTEAERRGVSVRLMLTDENDEANLTAATRLIQGGVDVRLLDHVYVHAKVVLVDGRQVFVGSQNWTATSLDANRELGVVLTEPLLVDRAEAVFASDWTLGSQQTGIE